MPVRDVAIDHPLRARVRACSVCFMINTMRTTFTVTAAVSMLALAACSAPAEPAPTTDPAPAVGVEAEGGVDAQEVEGDSEGEATLDPTGSPLGDANRGEALAMGYAPGDLSDIAWAGDVNTSDGSLVEYPDGLKVEFAGVEPGSAPVSEEEGDLDAGKDLVRVSLLVSNSGPDALPVDGGFIPFRVFEGENLVEVDAHVGYFGEEDALYSADDASVVAPGAELEVYRSFEVEPGTEIEVELNPDFFGVEHTPFVFYGITAP